MPVAGDIQREMLILFRDDERRDKRFVDVTAQLLLLRIEEPSNSESQWNAVVTPMPVSATGTGLALLLPPPPQAVQRSKPGECKQNYRRAHNSLPP
jgi:hypothetical protein